MSDSTFGGGRPLQLRAEDAQDLTVIAACLQDAIAVRRDLGYVPKQRRFAAVVNRYRWERSSSSAAGRGERVRTGLHFNDVTAVRTRGLTEAKDAVLELLTIDARPLADGTAEIRLLFAGGGEILLAVECIDGELSDLSEPWTAVARPTHPIDGGGAKD